MRRESVQIDQAADHELTRRVRNLLSARETLRPLHVDALNGVVFLNGTVRSFYEKQLAAAGCQRVAGVRAVENHVVVEANYNLRS